MDLENSSYLTEFQAVEGIKVSVHLTSEGLDTLLQQRRLVVDVPDDTAGSQVAQVAIEL